MKIGDMPPPTTYTPGESQKVLGINRHTFARSGLSNFLDYYQKKPGGIRRYLIENVSQFTYWLMVRRGLIALGQISPKSPLLPPGATMEQKRSRFEAWLVEDLDGTECPQCKEAAVQGELGGAIWCQNCGIIKLSDSGVVPLSHSPQ